MRVYGPNLDTLRDLSSEIRLLMATTPDVINTRETLQPGMPKISVMVNEEASQLTGMSLSDIARLLNASMSGMVQGSLVEETESIPVRVRVADSERAELNQLNKLRLPIPGAQALLTCHCPRLPIYASKQVVAQFRGETVSGSMLLRVTSLLAYCRKLH